MKILKQNYRVISEKGSYSLEVWLLEVSPEKEKVLVRHNRASKLEKLLEIRN